MSYYVRLLGGCLVLLLSLLIGRGYSAYKDRRIADYEGFIALIAHAEGRISRYLSHGCSLWQGFSNSALERSGFLKKLREGVTPAEAFFSTSQNTSLNNTVRERLGGYFKAFGSGYREDEIKRASEVRRELEIALQGERAELENSVKAVRVMLLGGALGVIILLL